MNNFIKRLKNKTLIGKSILIGMTLFLLYSSVRLEDFGLFYKLNSVILFAVMGAFLNNIFFMQRISKEHTSKNDIYLILTCVIIITLTVFKININFNDKYIYNYLIDIAIAEFEVIQFMIALKQKNFYGLNIFFIMNVAVILPALISIILGTLINAEIMVIMSSVDFILINCFILYSLLKMKLKGSYIYNKNFKHDTLMLLVIDSIIIKANIYPFYYLRKFRCLIILLAIASIIMYLVYKKLVIDIFLKMFNQLVAELNQKKNNNIQLKEHLRKKNKILLDKENLIIKGINNYKAIIDSSFDGIISFKNGKIKYLNKKAAEILNINNISDIFDMNISDFIEKYFKLDGNIYLKKKKAVGKIQNNGKLRYAEIFFQKITDEYKTIYINNISVIDEEMKMKQEMKKISNDFNEKTKFYMNVSHELQTPVNLIYSAAQLNRIYIKNNDCEKLLKNIDAIYKNSLRLLRTVNNFVFAERINRKDINVNMCSVNIVYVINNIISCCQKYLKMNLNTIIFESQADDYFVLCDEELIIYSILSIISNAVKYGKKNGVIAISLKELEGSRISISIENDGPLISQDKMLYIFDRFTCINKSLDRLKEGSGIALFIAKSLIQLQGGNIEFNIDGLGNKFEIVLKKANKYDKKAGRFPKINSLQNKVDVEFSDIYF